MAALQKDLEDLRKRLAKEREKAAKSGAPISASSLTSAGAHYPLAKHTVISNFVLDPTDACYCVRPPRCRVCVHVRVHARAGVATRTPPLRLRLRVVCARCSGRWRFPRPSTASSSKAACPLTSLSPQRAPMR
ncbi:hypothetical protein EON67_10135 [archaeon]|nr:MAG: hypothetical protein EON67_10135 [archaeon]